MKPTSLLATLLIAATPTLSFGAAIHAGLVNYWDFNGNLNDGAGSVSGNASTVADNGSFSGANGTDGIGYAAGFLGQGVSLNGAGGGAAGDENDGFVLIGRSADTLFGGKNLSMSVWFTVGTFDTNWQTLVSHGEGSQYRIARQADGNGIAFAGGIGDTPNPSGTAVNDGLWHNVFVTSENGVGSNIYLDGVLYSSNIGGVAINDAGNSNPNATPDFYIGGNPQTGANNREWDGMIDEVAQWNRILSGDEIGQIYSAGRAGLSIAQIPEPAVGLFAGMSGLLLAMRRRR